MPNDSYILEVAVFTVQMDFIKDIPMIREQIFDIIKTFPGFISMETFSPVDGQDSFADIVKWDTLEHAKSASKIVSSGDVRFQSYMEAIKDIKFMGHFKH